VPGTDPFLLFTRTLDALGLQYMVSGSVAAVYYGEPRLTHDVDIVLDLPAAEIPRLQAAFPGDRFYCPPEEVLEVEVARPFRGHFNLIHPGTGFKADSCLRGRDPLHDWDLARSRRVDLGTESMAIAPPEYVILRKLQYFREGGSEKHLRDIHRMTVALGDAWDRAALEEKVREFGLEEAWSQARSYGGPPRRQP
jgi:hypothetical protein